MLSERIRKAGKEVSWAPERGHRLLAAKKGLENQVTLVTKELKLTDWGSGAFRRGGADSNGISLNRQTTGHGGRYVEARQ
jgi:hypothetical protein